MTQQDLLDDPRLYHTCYTCVYSKAKEYPDGSHDFSRCQVAPLVKVYKGANTPYCQELQRYFTDNNKKCNMYKSNGSVEPPVEPDPRSLSRPYAAACMLGLLFLLALVGLLCTHTLSR